MEQSNQGGWWDNDDNISISSKPHDVDKDVDEAYNEEVNNNDNIDGSFRHNQQSNWSSGVGRVAHKTE